MQLFFLSILVSSYSSSFTPATLGSTSHQAALELSLSHQVTLEPIEMHQATRRKLVARFDAQMSQPG